MKCIAIFTEDGLDLIAYSATEAKNHVKDLKGMGCQKVSTKNFDSDADAYEYCERKGINA